MFAVTEQLLDALQDLGRALSERGEVASVFVIGGAAMLLLQDGPGAATRDVDVAAVLTPSGGATDGTISKELREAARVVAELRGLSPGWFSDAVVRSFGVRLPAGAVGRGSVHRFGALTVVAASRRDLIALKVVAALRLSETAAARHVRDLQKLEPSMEDLRTAIDWARTLVTDTREFEDRAVQLRTRLADNG